MAIVGTIANTIAGAITGVNTDPQQPNDGAGGGGGGASPFDLSTLTSAEDSSYQVRTHQSVPLAMFMKADGTKMVIVGNGADTLTTWTLPTAWDLSSIVDAPENTGIALGDSVPRGIWVSDDGKTMYWCGDTANGVLYAPFSTAWDASTKGTNVTSGALTGITQPSTIQFNSDGTRFYVMEYPANYKIHEFTCDNDPYDTSAGNWSSVGSYDVATDISSEYIVGLWLNGNQVFINTQSKNIHEFSWDGAAVSSLSYVGVQAYTQGQAGSWGLWMGDTHIGYVTGGLDHAALHTWGPHE